MIPDLWVCTTGGVTVVREGLDLANTWWGFKFYLATRNATSSTNKQHVFLVLHVACVCDAVREEKDEAINVKVCSLSHFFPFPIALDFM